MADTLTLKMKNFQEYSEALTPRKEGHVDSTLLCARAAIDIDTTSTVNQGSEFIVTIPVK